MKILCFIDSLGSGGAQHQLVNLACIFKEYGHEVRVLTYCKADFYKPLLDINHIFVDCIKDTGPIDRILKVREYIRKGDQDVVISFLETPNFISCLSVIGGRKWKLITNERGSKISSFKSIRGRIFKWFERFSDVIVCNSKNAQAIWEEYYPKYKNKLLSIYNVVLLSETKSAYYPRKGGVLRILVPASYQYLKNMDGLIEALKLLTEDQRSKLHVDWYGRIEVTTGNTEAYNKAVNKIEKYKLNDVITLNEVTQNIIDKMQQADVVALFSKSEGLPNAICEGMMLGKPVIMSKVSDYNNLIDSTHGFLCDSENPISIKEALVNVINLSNDELLTMGSNSKIKSEQLFGRDIISQKWMNLFRSLEGSISIKGNSYCG